jgi:hypothetical protein
MYANGGHRDMVCRDNLMRCIHYTELSLMAGAACICPDLTNEEENLFQDLTIQLAKQLSALKKLDSAHYGHSALANVNIVT